MKKLALILALVFGTSLSAMQDQSDSDSHNEVIESNETATVETTELCDDDLELEEDEEELFEKVGFLTTEDCALKGSFTSCYAESYVCGFEGCFTETEAGVIKPVQFVVFVHDDGKYYKIELTNKVKQYELDQGLGMNEVTIIGKYDEEENVISATEFRSPPPPKASFFKGCL
jgi:hypothetical protein